MMTPEPKKIVIIEDSLYMRTMLSNLLTEAGYNIIGEASTGLKGIDAVNTLKPDLVTLDIILPDMAGFEVLSAVRANNPDMPVVMVTGLGETDVREQAMSLGATAVIAKPFDEAAVLAELKDILNK